MSRKKKKREVEVLRSRGNYWLGAWQPYAVLVVLCLLVFGRTIGFDYTNCDDNMLIIDHFSSISDVSEIGSAFHTPYLDDYYRPLVTISLIVDAQVSGMSAWMYHCSNVILHIIVCCLIFYFLSKLQFSRIVSLIASMLFAVNPMVTQAVAWIPGRNDSLLTIFTLLSFITLNRFLATKRLHHLGVHLLLFLLSLLTKETALVLPVLFLLFSYLIARLPLFSKDNIRLMIGWLSVIVVWFIMRSWAFAGVQNHGGVYILSTPVTIIRVIVEVIGKMVVPIGMSTYPTFNTPMLIAGISVILLLVIVLLTNKETRRAKSLFALAWMTLFIIIGSVVHVVDAEHRFQYLECRVYTSLIGLLIFLAGLFQSNIPNLKRWSMRLCFLALPIFAVVSWMYSASYRDPISYWTDAIRTSPSAAEAHFNLGVIYHTQESDPVRASTHYAEAIALDSSNSIYHDNLGFALTEQGLLPQAQIEFNTAIRLSPADPFPRAHLASLFMKENNFAGAEEAAKAAFLLDSNSTDALSTLIDVYTGEKKYDQMRYYSERLRAIYARTDSLGDKNSVR
jgi:hypothetical protein